MKKIFLLPVFILTFFSFSSCEKDESLDPRPVSEAGQFVRLDITKRLLANSNLSETSFGGTLTSPGDKVEHYDLYVRRRNAAGVTTGNYVKLLTVNSFPYELAVTPQMLADVFEVPVTDLQIGEFYLFLGTSYGFDGKAADYNSLSTVVKTQTGMKQGYKFVTSMADDGTVEANTFDNYQLGL